LDLERADDEVAPGCGNRQLGDDRDTETGSDEALHRHVIVALKDDVRLEAGRSAGGGEHLQRRAAVDALHPRLLGELCQAEAAAAGEPMAGRERDVEAIVEQVHEGEPVESCRLLERKLVEERGVELTRAKLSERFLGIELDEAYVDPGMSPPESDDRAWDEHRACRGEGA